jgi:hypothetical protein
LVSLERLEPDVATNVDDGPSLDALFKKYVQRQSSTHIKWAKEKKEAARTVKTTDFKKKLGKELDKLNAIGLAGKDIRKAHNDTHAKTKQAAKAIRDQAAVVNGIIAQYRKIVAGHQKSGFTPDDHKPVWSGLGFALDRVDGDVGDLLRAWKKVV